MRKDRRSPKGLVGLALGAVMLLAGLGCKKAPASEEFAQAETLHGQLYAELLEDAYVDPRMEQVEELLQAVPKASRDWKSAQQLLEQISSERSKVQAENEARREAIAQALETPPGDFGSDSSPSEPQVEPPAPEPAVDAGASQPLTGMAQAEFEARFLGCFQAGPQVELTGQGLTDSYELRDLPSCRDRHPGFVGGVVLLGQRRVLAVIPKANLKVTRRYLDGGLAADGPP